ncbi:sensor histidine kinase [Streptomyces lydicus]|uniref:sensor histidine kinase n=1 Tax=Streptomyces lydicus TaxID=47763 RepID=UPI0036E7DBAB
MVDVLNGLPIVLTLLMPVAAWWLTVILLPVASADLLGLGSLTFALLMTTGPLVLALCTVRLQTSTVLGMWLISGLVVVGSGTLQGVAALVSFLIHGVGLIIALLLCGWLRAGARAAEQASAAEEERSRCTRLEERTTIARELHDVVVHHMSVVVIQAEAAQYRVQDPPPELMETFTTVRENAVLALAEMRRILGVIRADTPQAGRVGLERIPQPTLASLDRLVDGVRASGSSVEKQVTGKVRELAPGVELSAYRIVQEALSNAMRHAPGSEIGVELSYVATGFGLRVVNGPSARPAAASSGAGHGLVGMRERVAMLEGRLTTQKLPEGGFEVAAFLPDQTSAAQDGYHDE